MSERNNVLYLVVADTLKSAKQLMDAFAFNNMHELSKVSRDECTVYLKDGRIFKFTSMTSNNRIARGLRNWNIYGGEAFEEEVLCNANDVYGTKNVRYAKTTPMGFKPSELGKLGEAMSETAIKDKVELPDIFTHFIAIGPGTNK